MLPMISDGCKTNHEVLYFDSNDVWGRLKDLVRKIENQSIVQLHIYN